jgi:hypothetical protein
MKHYDRQEILREREELLASLAQRHAEGCQLACFYATRHVEDDLHDGVLYPSSGFIPFYRCPRRAAEHALRPGRDIDFCSPGVLVLDQFALGRDHKVRRRSGPDEQYRIRDKPIPIEPYLIAAVTDADLDAEFKARQQDHFVAKIMLDEPPHSAAELKRARKRHEALREEQKLMWSLVTRALVQLIAQQHTRLVQLIARHHPAVSRG